MEDKTHKIGTVITADALQQRVRQLGGMIAKDFAMANLFLVRIMDGAGPFVDDLVKTFEEYRRLNLSQICYKVIDLRVKSYHGQQNGQVEVEGELPAEIKGQNVMVVDDILDSGQTLNVVYKLALAKGARWIGSCVLLAKPFDCQTYKLPVTYIGYSIRDQFVVGYGMDLDGQYRDLDYIGELV